MIRNRREPLVSPSISHATPLRIKSALGSGIKHRQPRRLGPLVYSDLSLMLAVSLIIATAMPTLAEQHASTPVGHRVLLHGVTNDGPQLVIVEPDGHISWRMDWPSIHDLHILDDGRILTRMGKTKVVEVDPKTKQVVWQYDCSASNGNHGQRVEVHAFQRLRSGHTMIAESGIGRLIEVDREGRLQHEIQLVRERPSLHSDTRLVRQTSNADYLVAHEADGCVRRYNRAGEVVWQFDVPLFGRAPRKGHGLNAFGNQVFAAIELQNGNTLVSTGNGHSVLEITPSHDIVWALHQDDLPGIRLAWTTTLQVLKNGHLVIGNCHAGPDEPLLIEIDRKTNRVVWTLDRHADFGNAVSNSLIMPKS
ncbi:MAG: PQQ-binding-like beta-propeller repeat protein [Planctomycetota bacterium]